MDGLDIFEAQLRDGCTVGLVGVGRFGQKLRQIAEARGCRVLLCDPPRNLEEASELGEHFFELWGNGMGGCQVSNEGMEVFLPLYSLARADIVSVQVPLVESGQFPTRALIDEAFLSLLKPDAKLICFSPVEVISPSALGDKRILLC